MQKIYVFSGPCGCGKTTLSEAWAEHLVQTAAAAQVYVIHGDSFHAGFFEASPDDRPVGAAWMDWPDILRFNWSCILHTAQQALDRGLDVIADYVVEDELPMLIRLASEAGAELYYFVLTATEDEITERLKLRGQPELTERALFLRKYFENDPLHSEYLYSISGMKLEEEIAFLAEERHRVLPT